jgi:putative oxidoreductase
MLNTFPTLLTYSFVAPTILRAVVGLIFLDLGLLKFKGERERWIASFEALHLKPSGFLVQLLGVIELVGGLFIFIGLYTQVSAIVLGVFTTLEMYAEYKDALLLKRNFTFYLLILAILVSLIFTGAGAYAFDIPL